MHKLFFFVFLSFIACKSQKTSVDNSKTQINSTNNNSTDIVETKNPDEGKMSEGFPKEPKNNTGKTAGIIYLKEGENKFFKEYEMNVTFKGVSEDSRCPEGVNCVWAGAGVANVELMGVATRPMTVAISTVNMKGRNLSKSAVFNGYKIELKELSPYPSNSNKDKLSGNYTIGIVINKVAENDTGDTNLTPVYETTKK